jgi:two-component system, sensor histidine kinase and response regulator
MREEDPRRTRLAAYGLAVGLTIATLLGRLSLDVGWGQRPLLILFMLPIILSAYWGGFGPGIVATILAALSVDYFLIPPARSLRIHEGRDLIQLLIFVANGTVIGILNEALHRARATAAQRARAGSSGNARQHRRCGDRDRHRRPDRSHESGGREANRLVFE